MTAVQFELMIVYMSRPEDVKPLTNQEEEYAWWLIEHVSVKEYNEAYRVAFELERDYRKPLGGYNDSS